MLHWHHQGVDHQAAWRSESGLPAPRRVVVADDTLSADTAYRLACEGTALLWQGDFQNARHLLDALKRRLDKPARKPAGKAAGRGKPRPAAEPVSPAQAFHLHRQAQGQRARVLNSLLVPLQPDYGMQLRRAPDWREACTQAWGAPSGDAGVQAVALRELLGVVGAYEWRKKGVAMPVLGAQARIHPHYGVFSPVRGEYVDLVAQAPLPAAGQALAFDIGVGTGVLSALLVQRGVRQVVGTDLSPRALACAQENLQRLGLSQRVQLQACNLFPEGQAGLIVCNPPWLPARAVTTLEQAVYDEHSAMLRGFLTGLRAHLLPQGEGWLILSDLAEHLGLRSRAELLDWIEAAGLQVVGKLDVRPRHGKARDTSDPLHAARAQEVTSLWRLQAR
ncbi:class I SAM-dependent methyltransferase [Comamonas aquatica]|uniref:class I SAM-dependent methyltransferase n=1 Tax=Comamonas aquatica TaxID=225991 RepID=UPI00244CD4FB|nr:class I SAM-dependent methyltransferase [Comamonas aquatica]MDH0199355.1 class I SAM-dependent methyltransferase [Comamonas aquatica]MDH0380239.1 class I SAM-dependent methyltransferase [Comamonas aquatica]MDH0428259.1 class I SAM-dependent methyltransferase [Comamonas aquatica]MDH0898020.1 class I SAM-dependent methyltransferase [Comamonas aquatica]MDH0940191.1 class I SAM-dependent methyltransferase [Comamonas aquatica]